MIFLVTVIVIVNEIILFSLTNIFVTVIVNENHTACGLLSTTFTVFSEFFRPVAWVWSSCSMNLKVCINIVSRCKIVVIL